MSPRRLVNLAASHLFKNVEGKHRENLIFLLREPFDNEMSEQDAAKAERRRIAMELGAYEGQKSILGAFDLKSKA